MAQLDHPTDYSSSARSVSTARGKLILIARYTLQMTTKVTSCPLTRPCRDNRTCSWRHPLTFHTPSILILTREAHLASNAKWVVDHLRCQIDAKDQHLPSFHVGPRHTWRVSSFSNHHPKTRLRRLQGLIKALPSTLIRTRQFNRPEVVQ